MSRKSRRAEAAREAELARAKVSSPTEDFVHAAAGRVGPLAQSAADKLGPLAEAAADALGAAADKVSPLAHSAANRVGPLAQSAAGRVGPLAQTAAGRIGPLAGQTVDRVTPYAKVAADRVTPLAQSAAGYAQNAAERFTPIATTALLRGNEVTAEAYRRISPVLDGAVVRVSPAVAAARGRTVDLLPRLSGALSAATGTLVPEPAPPAKTELVLPAKKPRGRWVRRIAIVGALGAVAVVVVRKFVGGQEADWQAARPRTPAVPPQPSPAPRSTETSGGTTGSSPLSPEADRASVEPVTVEEDFAAAEDLSAAGAAPVKMINLNDDGDVEETVVDEVVLREPVADLPETEPTSSLPRSGKSARWSGEGVYVGSEPPEGFVIKGNDRSMKYHMPEAAGYGRTSAEVWFNSEEAAQRAGFVRAQR